MLDYERRAGDDVRRVVANFGAEAVDVDLTGWDVQLATGEVLGPESAVLLRPS